MRDILEEVVRQELLVKPKLNLYTDNIAMEAHRIRGADFAGLQCKAYHSAKRTYMRVNFFCDSVDRPLDLLSENAQVSCEMLAVCLF